MNFAAERKRSIPVAEAKHLRIVDQYTWNAARAIKTKRHHQVRPRRERPSAHFPACSNADMRRIDGIQRPRQQGNPRAMLGASRKWRVLQWRRRVYVEEIESGVVKSLRQRHTRQAHRCLRPCRFP
jgi:hypothetical protein